MGPKNILRIVLALALIVTFFMPFDLNPESSPWNTTLEVIKDPKGTSQFSYGLFVIVAGYLIIFLSAIFILFRSVMQRGSSGLLIALPFIGFLIIILYGAYMDRDDLGRFFSSILKGGSIGFYISIISSILLLFTGGRMSSRTVAV